MMRVDAQARLYKTAQNVNFHLVPYATAERDNATTDTR